MDSARGKGTSGSSRGKIAKNGAREREGKAGGHGPGDSPSLSRGELLVLALSALLILAFYFIPAAPQGVDLVRKGVVEASSLGRDALPLVGDWECLEDPDAQGGPAGHKRLPYSWKRPFGYAVYRVKISGLDPGVAYALQVPYMATSYRLLLDGEEALTEGLVSRTKEGARASYRSGVVELGRGATGHVLTLEVSNFIHRRGGPHNAIYLGEEAAIRRYDSLLLVEALACAAIGLVMGGIYVFNAAVQRRMNFLFVGFIFILGGLNFLISSPPVLPFQLFPDLDFGLYKRLGYLVSFLVSPCALAAARNLFGGVSDRRLAWILGLYALVISPVFLTPYAFFSRLSTLYQLAHFLVFCVTFAICFRGVNRGYRFAKPISASFLLLFGMTFSDILFANSRINGGQFLALSFISTLMKLPLAARSLLDVLSYIGLLALINGFSLVAFVGSSKEEPAGRHFAEGSDLERIRRECLENGLSPRETEVAVLTLQGKKNLEIGEELFISLSTVKSHLSRVYEKTGTKTRAELFSRFWR